VEDRMDNLTFGMTMIVIGMGGTLLALSLFAILMNVLKMLFPFKEEKNK
jgi:Na+-transporting methylmalonyl-CoA/oxaloacetate decarboxylase gamma subunit